MIEFSVIIVTFNSGKFIKECLGYFSSQNNSDFEVIVIDNASKDNTVKLISDNYPEVILIKNNDNLGPAQARNQGIDIAKGRWILALDCDTIPEKDFLNNFNEIKEDLASDIGIIQPKILQYDKKTIYSTGIFISWLRRFYDIGRGKIDSGQFEEEKFVFAACSAAAFYRKGMLEEIREKSGFFDENFFFLVEDIDLSWRARNRGYKTLYYPKIICYHYGNSSGVNKKFRQYLSFRNRYLLIQKNDKIGWAKKILLFLFYDFPRLSYLVFSNNYVLKSLKEIGVFYRKAPMEAKKLNSPAT